MLQCRSTKRYFQLLLVSQNFLPNSAGQPKQFVTGLIEAQIQQNVETRFTLLLTPSRADRQASPSANLPNSRSKYSLKPDEYFEWKFGKFADFGSCLVFLTSLPSNSRFSRRAGPSSAPAVASHGRNWQQPSCSAELYRTGPSFCGCNSQY